MSSIKDVGLPVEDKKTPGAQECFHRISGIKLIGLIELLQLFDLNKPFVPVVCDLFIPYSVEYSCHVYLLYFSKKDFPRTKLNTVPNSFCAKLPDIL